jgi:putative chitinase
MKINAIDIVNRIAPNARTNYLEAIRNGNPLFEQHEITTPLRMAHFLAQACTRPVDSRSFERI